jgi:tRNA (guanine26-N2/guanine27-N2)-dimethyltransferase
LRSHSRFEEEVTEGKARVRFSPKSARVFYNPKMSLNRDLAVLFAASNFSCSRELRVCDPTTASGIRAARYALEVPNVAKVVAADRDPDAVELASQTVSLNKLEDKVSVVASDANLLLLSHMNERFDVVDLDPFGSPAPFFESSLRATGDGGILAATATDMGPLSGARAAACVRKYGVRPVRTEFEKEMAVRILAGCLVNIAGRLELGVSLKFAHATDHYARLYALVTKGRKAANKSSSKLGFIQYCPSCLARQAIYSLDSVTTNCEYCNSKTKIGGPIWLGPLWDDLTVESMIQHTPTLHSSRLSEIQKNLACIKEEAGSSPFYYTTGVVAKIGRAKPVSLNRVLEVLEQEGFRATRTHFNPTGFHTNAPANEIVHLFRDTFNKP